MNETLTLSIQGMHCGACVRRVTNALQEIPGVHVGSVAVGSARLEFAPDQATPAEIAAAVNRIGFSAQIEK
jgi:copper chaperone/Cu+-exporting ATPase